MFNYMLFLLLFLTASNAQFSPLHSLINIYHFQGSFTVADFCDHLLNTAICFKKFYLYSQILTGFFLQNNDEMFLTSEFCLI